MESPYKVRDLGIQVAIDNSKSQTGENGETQYLSAEEEDAVRAGIASILNSIVSTTIAKDYGNVNPTEKVSIVFQEFNGKPGLPQNVAPVIPKWLYGVGAGLLLVILLLVGTLLRRRKKEGVVEDVQMEDQQPMAVPNMEESEETESSLRRKQLEKMASDEPEDFAKLLRSWIAED
ncbi:hypothetical protein [Terrihalobacillus insolitus]|uniref:hypothetical protein n=1 Tax=Terrihalobacillus insolitus TaxID=2950438 RepID=UPI002FEE3FF5